jgi:glycerate kinase
MRVIVATDKFAGTLTAEEAARTVADGWRTTAPDDDCQLMPMSDGGPGLLRVLQQHLGGERRELLVADPLGRPVEAAVLVCPDALYVESAEAVGLHLLEKSERDPERASSAGLGDLLRGVLDRGWLTPGMRLVVGLGGSATVDGGRGMLDALGRVSETLRHTQIDVLCDVDNPLLGPGGAAAVFGPQKGASPQAVLRLEKSLQAHADHRGLPVLVPGAGAAGGLGSALASLGGRLLPGAPTVATLVGLPNRLARADLVVTGEGAYDATSLRGKVVGAVAALALVEAVPCLVVAGQVAVGRREMSAHGISAAYSLADAAGGVDIAQREAVRWLREVTARVARDWSRS